MVPEIMPEYPGGTDALLQYLRTTVKYPVVAQEKGEQGRVYLEFVVSETGKIIDVTILKGVSESLNNEAIRVAEAMPNWIPGKSAGKSVNVSYRLPVKFALTTKK